MPRRTPENGYVLIWILVVLAVIAAGIGSIEFTVDDHRPSNPTMYWIFGIGLTIATSVVPDEQALADLARMLVLPLIE